MSWGRRHHSASTACTILPCVRKSSRSAGRQRRRFEAQQCGRPKNWNGHCRYASSAVAERRAVLRAAGSEDPARGCRARARRGRGAIAAGAAPAAPAPAPAPGPPGKAKAGCAPRARRTRDRRASPEGGAAHGRIEQRPLLAFELRRRAHGGCRGDSDAGGRRRGKTGPAGEPGETAFPPSRTRTPPAAPTARASCAPSTWTTLRRSSGRRRGMRRSTDFTARQNSSSARARPGSSAPAASSRASSNSSSTAAWLRQISSRGFRDLADPRPEKVAQGARGAPPNRWGASENERHSSIPPAHRAAGQLSPSPASRLQRAQAGVGKLLAHGEIEAVHGARNRRSAAPGAAPPASAHDPSRPAWRPPRPPENASPRAGPAWNRSRSAPECRSARAWSAGSAHRSRPRGPRCPSRGRGGRRRPAPECGGRSPRLRARSGGAHQRHGGRGRARGRRSS